MSLWERSNNSTNSADTPFCAEGGGTWSAIQSLIVFLGTNMIAHAATIRVPGGSNKTSNLRRVLAAIFNPIYAGNFAFRLFGRWRTRCLYDKKWWQRVWAGDKLEDAVTAGAVAVYIPLHFAPLLAGRWDLAEDHRRIVTWYHRDFMRPYKNLPKAEFASSDTFPEYLPFILLSKSRLKSQYRELSDSSQFIMSLPSPKAAPYLLVIPYIILSLVNLFANLIVSAYREVTILPMKADHQPWVNEVYVCWRCPQTSCSGKNRNCPEREQHRLKILRITESSTKPPKSRKRRPEGDQDTAVKEPIAYEGLPKNLLIDFSEFTGKEWVPELPIERHNDRHNSTSDTSDAVFQCEKVSPAGFLLRKEIWTRVCYQISWKFGAEKKVRLGSDSQDKDHAIFLKQKVLIKLRYHKLHWSLMKLEKPTDEDTCKLRTWREDMNKLEKWFQKNYPDVDVDVKGQPKATGYSYRIASIITLLITTMLLGALTRFQWNILNNVIWLILWTYGGGLLRWRWLNENSLHEEPCLKVSKWLSYGVIHFASGLLAIGVYGGLAAIVAEVFGDICPTSFALYIPVWISIGFGAVAVFVLLNLLISFLQGLLGTESIDDGETQDLGGTISDALGGGN